MGDNSQRRKIARPLPNADPKPLKMREIMPKMLVKALARLQDSQLSGVHFNPAQVTLALTDMYPWLEEKGSALAEEVEDKLKCAAAANIIGHQISAGYHLLSLRNQSVNINTESELTFWLLYKKIVNRRRTGQNSENERKKLVAPRKRKSKRV